MRSALTPLLAFMLPAFLSAQTFTVSSPDLHTTVTISAGAACTYSVSHKGQPLINPSAIGLLIRNKKGLDHDFKVSRKEMRSVSDTLWPVVREKRKAIPEKYNELRLAFHSGLALWCRAFDDGIAWRWESSFKGDIIVDSEIVSFNLASPVDTVYYPREQSFYSHNERLYLRYNPASISDTDIASLPALVADPSGTKMLITESDLLDYAGLWLRGSRSEKLVGIHPDFPAAEEETSVRDRVVTRRENFVAKTSGTRNFPWRIVGISDKDEDLINNQLSYILASGTNENFSWVRPGKVAWDWWNALNSFGVNFKSGINTATYKYFIDFAAAYHLEYIILDEGWSKQNDLLTVNPDVDMDALSAYGREKGVDLILWVSWLNLDKQLDQALKEFAGWRVKGIKVDFMQRDDQEMVNFYERVAKAAVNYHMLVDFHGAFKPTGLQRKYPNALTREGVFGNENSKWDNQQRIAPPHNVTLPYIRMVAGPMDYTPGAMLNAQADQWAPIFQRPMSLGTRCQQMAMYVVYESPLQMLCDNPSNYYREPECTEFISRVPSVWDETVPLAGRVGSFIAVARKSKEGDWFIGAMTDWTERDIPLTLSFLGDGDYSMETFEDGINADRMAQDYRRTVRSVHKGDNLKIHVAKGGGWVARIRHQ
ncbi:MAG TPA: glycoside hydrolase family 97 protein [Puia sp.]|nr:glycoside hydrolase family 97 protein [Puia sp.]